MHVSKVRPTILFLASIYCSLAIVFYVSSLTLALLILAVPWSLPLMALSRLILHATVDGDVLIRVGGLIGVFINAFLILYYFSKRSIKG